MSNVTLLGRHCTLYFRLLHFSYKKPPRVRTSKSSSKSRSPATFRCQFSNRQKRIRALAIYKLLSCCSVQNISFNLFVLIQYSTRTVCKSILISFAKLSTLMTTCAPSFHFTPKRQWWFHLFRLKSTFTLLQLEVQHLGSEKFVQWIQVLFPFVCNDLAFLTFVNLGFSNMSSWTVQ